MTDVYVIDFEVKKRLTNEIFKGYTVIHAGTPANAVSGTEEYLRHMGYIVNKISLIVPGKGNDREIIKCKFWKWKE